MDNNDNKQLIYWRQSAHYIMLFNLQLIGLWTINDKISCFVKEKFNRKFLKFDFCSGLGDSGHNVSLYLALDYGGPNYFVEEDEN